MQQKDVEGVTEEVEIRQRTPLEGENGIMEIPEFEPSDEGIPVQLDPVTGEIVHVQVPLAYISPSTGCRHR